MNHRAKILVVSELGVSEKAISTLRWCLAKRPRLIAIFGRDCRALEDICDQIIEETDFFVVTTSHSEEPLEDVISMVKTFDHGELGDRYDTVKL